MSETPVMTLADCNNVRIDLGEIYDPSRFFIDPSTADDAFFWMRELPYIQTISEPEQAEDNTGKAILKTNLHDGKFTVLPEKFFKQIQTFLKLKRNGGTWFSDGNVITASYVKKKIQDALLPFGIPEKELTSLYKQLSTYCFDSETLVNPLTVVDLKSSAYKRPPFIVDQIMCPGLTILAAPSKTGKSFLALDLACCVAEGQPFWGFCTDGGSVLYLDLEDAPWRVQNRLPIVGRKDGQDIPERLSVTFNANTLDNGLIKQLEMWLNTTDNPKLVIIDTLQLIKGKASRNESSYSADYRFMRPLHDLALERGIAILCVTHTRKNTGFASDDVFDSILGSTAQMGGSDASWIISGKRGSNTKTFTATGRDFESVEYEIERVEGRWAFKGTTEDRQEEQEKQTFITDPVIPVIRDHLIGSGGSWKATAQTILEEVAKASGSYPEPDALRMSKRLRDLAPILQKYGGIIVHSPTGGGRTGRIFTFELQPFV